MAKKKTSLEKLRREADITIERLASEAGIKYGTLVRYLNGSHEPTVTRAARICAVLSGAFQREIPILEVFIPKK